MAAKKIALFIDADNISAKFGKQIIDTLESRGEIFIRRIYGNWEKLSLHGWNESILNFSLRAVQQPDFAAGKNATDMSLAIDAMDVLYDGKAEIFALVSNDSDFTPLVIRLREGGINVIGMGNENASVAFRNACNEFIDFDKISVAVSVAPKVQPVQKISPLSVPKISSTKEKKLQRELQSQRAKEEHNKRLQQLHNILRETAKAHGDKNGFVRVNLADSAIAKKNLGFGVKNLGYGYLQKFVAAFPKLYEVQKKDNAYFYRCLPVEPKISNDKLQKIHDALHEVVNTYGGEKGFVDLSRAGDFIGKKNLSIKNSGYSTISKFITAFPNLYEVKGMGAATYYRCRKIDNLQPIHDILHEVSKAYTDLNDGGGFTDLARAGQKAREKKIDVRNLGYSSWSKFVSDFPKLYAVKKVGTIVYYRCL